MKPSLQFLSAIAAFAVFSPLASAQEPTPSATEAPAATPSATIAKPPAAPAAPVAPKKPAAPAAKASPVPSGSPADSAKRKEAITIATAAVDELAATVDYQTAQAKRIEARGKIAARSQGEIGRARERATDLVKLQLDRVQKAGSALPTTDDGLVVLLEEIRALAQISHESAASIAHVRTYDGATEDALQEISTCFEKIGENAESFLGELSDEAARQGAKVDIQVHEDGSVHFNAGDYDGDDRVFYGAPVVIGEDEVVNDAVSIGESVTVNGHVLGSAVAIGGNVLVGKTGRVDGDASAVGGRITIEEGGRIDGEQVSLGPGAATALLTQFASPPAPPRPLGTRIGISLVTAAAEFLCFFLLGLLTIAIIPKRVDVVAEGLVGHPFKSGAFGLLAGFLFVPLTLLLAVIVIGIPLIPILWFGYFLLAFVGYVALAQVVGRRVPTKVPLTGTATFALGAGLVVAVGLVPILGKLVWFLAGFFVLGAALWTRFGQDRGNGSAAAAPETGTGLSSIA